MTDHRKDALAVLTAAADDNIDLAVSLVDALEPDDARDVLIAMTGFTVNALYHIAGNRRGVDRILSSTGIDITESTIHLYPLRFENWRRPDDD